MTDSFLNIKVFKNTTVLRDVNEPIRLDDKNWSNYIKSLKSAQKSVNDFLTELVEAEKELDGEDNAEHESSSDGAEDNDPKFAISPCKKKKIT